MTLDSPLISCRDVQTVNAVIGTPTAFGPPLDIPSDVLRDCKSFREAVMGQMALLAIFLVLMVPAFGQQRGGQRREGTLKEGDRAPDFDLDRLQEKGKEKEGARIRLSHFSGKRPVVLIFGSYT
jgi:hypothetical protein